MAAAFFFKACSRFSASAADDEWVLSLLDELEDDFEVEDDEECLCDDVLPLRFPSDPYLELSIGLLVERAAASAFAIALRPSPFSLLFDDVSRIGFSKRNELGSDLETVAFELLLALSLDLGFCESFAMLAARDDSAANGFTLLLSLLLPELCNTSARHRLKHKSLGLGINYSPWTLRCV